MTYVQRSVEGPASAWTDSETNRQTGVIGGVLVHKDINQDMHRYPLSSGNKEVSLGLDHAAVTDREC